MKAIMRPNSRPMIASAEKDEEFRLGDCKAEVGRGCGTGIRSTV